MFEKDIRSINSGDGSVNLIADGNITFIKSDIDPEFVDPAIQVALGTMLKCRYYAEYDKVKASTVFGRQLIDGKFFKGSNKARGKALAWCSRFLSVAEKIDIAEEFFIFAEKLESCHEVEIAGAFIDWRKGNKSKALETLVSINSPASRSAALIIVKNNENNESALEWLKANRLSLADFDIDGKFFVLLANLELGKWDDAREILKYFNEYDFEDIPALYYLCAMTHLVSVVPDDYKTLILKQLPLAADEFPLASDKASIDARRTASELFSKGASSARKLNCNRIADLNDDFALWLELRDPNSAGNGKKILTEKLNDLDTSLRLVPLAIHFGIKINVSSVQQEIERQSILHGTITLDAALARFGLAFIQKTPEAAANYIDKYYTELAKYIDIKSMRMLQIDLYSRARLIEKASCCLNLLKQNGITEIEEHRLRRIISEAEGADTIESRMSVFKESDSLTDLKALVDELEQKGDWERLYKYGDILFKRTRSLQDAKVLMKTLNRSLKFKEIVGLYEINEDIMSQSRQLKLMYCWALFYEGEFLKSRAELRQTGVDRENQNFRDLELNLYLAMGDWSSLTGFIAYECKNKENRDSFELIRLAQIALQISPIHVKDLIFAAANKAKDDPHLLFGAYILATSADIEDNSEVIMWLHKAAKFSGENGPMQQVTLKDFFKYKPEWDRRDSQIWKMFREGSIPLFLAADSLNKSLTNLSVYRALINLSETDPRKRSAIPAYSGNRMQSQISIGKIDAGIDATALLTFSLLNILDTVLDAFATIYVPHSTLLWLFEEIRRARYHQPSRIKDAHFVRDLLARGYLKKFIPTTDADADLSSQIGHDLALLIAEAEQIKNDVGMQKIVVRPSPVHLVSSFMEEEADLSKHSAVLSSCSAVVKILRSCGQITSEEENKAISYLQMQEKPWIHQPEIRRGAVLYLDPIAITYFLRLKMLDKIYFAGFEVIIPPEEIMEANTFISYENISNKVDGLLKNIQESLRQRIESGKIKFGNANNTDSDGLGERFENFAYNVLDLARKCDVVISDDRFVNQHAYASDGDRRVPISTTLDILDFLLLKQLITIENFYEYRTFLRRAGYLFIPIAEEELLRHLMGSKIKDDKVIESAELKAVREEILQIRMSDWLQFPKESAWLHAIFINFLNVLKKLWSAYDTIQEIIPRSDWVVDMVDIRGWSHRLPLEDRKTILNTDRGLYILLLLNLPAETSFKMQKAYCKWANDAILKPVKEQDNDLFKWVVDYYKKLVASIVNKECSND